MVIEFEGDSVSNECLTQLVTNNIHASTLKFNNCNINYYKKNNNNCFEMCKSVF